MVFLLLLLAALIVLGIVLAVAVIKWLFPRGRRGALLDHPLLRTPNGLT
jgi:hypothetical protein